MNEEADDEIRELLGPASVIIRTVRPESFLSLFMFRNWHAEAVKVIEFAQLLDFRLESVVWKAAPPYSVLLRLIAESQRRYFVTSTGPILRLFREQVDNDHLLMECQQSDWSKLSDALLKSEFGSS